MQFRHCIIESVFTVTGRGTVIVPGEWENGQVKVGDWIEVRRQDGSSIQARITSVERGRRMTSDLPVAARGLPGLLLGNLSREDVKPGDEIWSVVNPPQEEIPTDNQKGAQTSAKRSLWRRLFGGQS